MEKTTAVCCTPLLAAPLPDADAEELASVFKALADPVRLRLLSLIADAPGAEVCACDLVDAIGRSQPTLSHHLKILWESGLLDREKRGPWVWYRLRPERVRALRDALALPSSNGVRRQR